MKKEKRRVAGLQLLAVGLIVVLFFSCFMVLKNCMPQQQEEKPKNSKTVVYDGVEYFPRQDIDVLLVMGIDKEGVVEASGSYNNDGEADVVLLVIFDHELEKLRVLNVNRDTMTQIPVLGIGGKAAGTSYGQLALAHTYGSGLEDSCENTREAVSGLLGGIRIDYYIAMHMDAIAILNDAVDGVTVQVTEDFSASDSDIPMGEVTLRGQQAVDFVRFRKNVGDELNVSRMERQLEYVSAFFTELQKKLEESSGFVLDAYDRTADYIVTDCSETVLSSMFDRYSDYELEELQTLPGENRKGEAYMEFYPDEEALRELVLELFYAPK